MSALGRPKKPQAQRDQEEQERLARQAAARAWAKEHGCPEWDADRWMDASPQQWEGRKRMALAREGAGIELDVIDLVAIHG